MNGNLGSSAVTVQTGGILGGTGTVGSTVVQAGGRVAPGTLIGTLVVNGDFTQATGSFYDVELDSLGQSDLIDVSDRATLESGTTLTVTKLDAPRLALGMRYTVLTADGGVTGSIRRVRAPRPLHSAVVLRPSQD